MMWLQFVFVQVQLCTPAQQATGCIPSSLFVRSILFRYSEKKEHSAVWRNEKGCMGSCLWAGGRAFGCNDSKRPLLPASF
jgi:hypothetical protein